MCDINTASETGDTTTGLFHTPVVIHGLVVGKSCILFYFFIFYAMRLLPVYILDIPG